MDGSTVFRSAPESSAPPAEPTPQPGSDESNTRSADMDISDIRPVEDGSDAVLLALGIEDSTTNLPQDDASNLDEVASYIGDILKNKGIDMTMGAYKKTLDGLKEDMGIDPDASPEVVLDRIGGVVKAWKSLAFITDPKEKRTLFLRLATLENSKEMNKFVFEQMSRKEVWL